MAINFITCEYFIFVATKFLCGIFGIVLLDGPQEWEQVKEVEQKEMMNEMMMRKKEMTEGAEDKQQEEDDEE